MNLTERLQARIAARPATPARTVLGLPAAPPPPDLVGSAAAVKVASLADRLRTHANIPASWLPPEPEAPRAVEGSHELDRIAALPRRPADWPDVPDLSDIYVHTPGPCNGGCKLCTAPDGTHTPVSMKRVQSAAIWEAVQENGGLDPIGVGHGKTLIVLLLHDAMRAKRTVVMVQPDLRDQLINIDVPRYGRHFVLPHVALWDGTPRDGQVTVIAYSTLSSAKNADVLEVIGPDLVVCDEGHNFRHLTSARTKRFRRFVEAHPECRRVITSGSIMTRSIKDGAHLSHWALRARSPYPNHYPTLQSFAAALDVLPNDGETFRLMPGALLAFCSQEETDAMNRGEITPTEAAQLAYGRRITETPGVVATDDGGASMGLEIRARRPPPLPEDVKKAMAHVRDTWTTPDGEEVLEDGSAVARVMKQLAAGFYYIWDWGPGGRDEEWLAARREWHVQMRGVLSHSKAGLDSPLLVARAASRGELGAQEQTAWTAWSLVKARWNPSPPTKEIWLSDWLIQDMMEWAAEREQHGQSGIIWFSHKPVGDALRGRGIKTFAGGADASEILKCDPRNNGELVIAASIAAHGVGKNLQAYQANLITTPMANGTKWEQLLGRTHRPGQQADTVFQDVYTFTPELRAAFDRAMEDARFQERTMKQRQKLLYAHNYITDEDL